MLSEWYLLFSLDSRYISLMQIYDAVSAMIVMKQRDKGITIYGTMIFLKLLSHIVEEDTDRMNGLGD